MNEVKKTIKWKKPVMAMATAALLGTGLFSVESPFVSPKIAHADSQTYTVSADVLNVRSSANASSSKIGRVYQGQALSVISQESNGWYKINFNGQTGYVSGEFVRGSGAQPPKTDNGTSNSGQTINGTYKVTANALNVRSGSNPGTRSLGLVYQNQTLSVIGKEANGWYKINFNGQTGYVSGEFVRSSGEQPPKTDNGNSGQTINGTYKVTANALNVRSGSNPGTRSLGLVYQNQALSVIGKEANGWYKINFNGQIGYVSGEYVKNQNVDNGTSTGEQNTFPRMNVPVEMQRDFNDSSRDLQTGCEITAVSMMLRYTGANVDKIKLAKEMPYHSSNPNKGYVGNPWGDGPINTVYPSALTGLVSKYTGSSVNLTGSGLGSIKDRLNIKHPVVAWVGSMHGFGIHAITLTGYDNNRVYYNDPWTGEKDASMSWNSFNNKWSSKSSRALSY
ncbi:SH3 domain-containing protein [Bacillus cereus]|uniref:SH3 domain-containing protein n=1 Tax=Bacillus cereus TaxID=1396 RepID=UPI0035CB6B1D